MTTATPVHEAPREDAIDTVDSTEEPFVLEVHVISDVRRDLMPVACGTDDGCKPSCASSCTST